MFASTDGRAWREVRAVAVREGLRRPFVPMRDAPAASRRAAGLPDDAALRALARELARLPSRDKRLRIALAVKPPSWRTYSWKRIQPGDAGEWRVDICDAAGNV